jgi:hypothetical protein
LTNPDSYATSLLTILTDYYGTEAWEWSPQTMYMEFQEDFQADLPQVNIDKIMAAINVITTDDFFTSLPRFIRLCNVLADDEFDPSIFDPADTAEMAWAITEVLLLRRDDMEEEPFSEEIRFYIGHMLSEEGVTNPPDVLKIAARDLPTEDPLAPFASDPAMYASFYATQQSKSDEITDMLRRQLGGLMKEMQRLPLNEGNTEDLLERIQGPAN